MEVGYAAYLSAHLASLAIALLGSFVVDVGNTRTVQLQSQDGRVGDRSSLIESYGGVRWPRLWGFQHQCTVRESVI